MSFYYSSISSILKSRPLAADSTDAWLERIQLNIRNELICRYRSILNVYAYTWPTINEVGHIEFSKAKYYDSMNINHDVRTIVIIRLLREWMRRINLVITNVETKFA
jgi:hypothetical protein